VFVKKGHVPTENNVLIQMNIILTKICPFCNVTSSLSVVFFIVSVIKEVGKQHMKV
jgi:hypothetical protein